MKTKSKEDTPQALSPADASMDVQDLQREVERLKKELSQQTMYAEAYNEMINVAEKQFNIPIRKKVGAKQ